MNKLVNANKWWLLGAAWVYTFTFVFNHYWSKSASYETIAHNFSERIQQQIHQFDAYSKDSVAINQLRLFQPDAAISRAEDTYYYLYQDSPNGMQLRYWNNASIVPAPTDIPYQDTVKTIKYKNGFYVMATHKLPGGMLTLVQLILVQQDYYVHTANLQSVFPGYPGLEKHIDSTTTRATPYAVGIRNHPPLFYLLPNAAKPIEIFNWASLLVQIVATLMLLVFIYRVGVGLVRQQQLVSAFVWVITTSLLIRLCIGSLNFPVNVSNTVLFQPINRPTLLFASLGGLLLNLLLLVWVVYFGIHTRNSWLPLLNNISSKKKKIVAVLGFAGLLPISFMLCQLLLRLIAQPQISFDVANFFSLGWDTVGAIVCLYFICVLHYRLLHLANEIADRLWPQEIHFKLLLAAVTGLFIISVLLHWLQGQILIWLLLWLLVTLVLEDKLPGLFFYGMERSVRFVFWLIWYGIAGTMLVQSQQRQKDLAFKLHLAQTQASYENTEVINSLKRSLSSNAVKDLQKDPFSVEDSIYNHHLRSNIAFEFNQWQGGYTINTYLFDSTGRGLYNRDSTTYETLNTIVEQQGKTTNVPDLYLYESGLDQFRYLVRKHLQQDSLNGGSMFITAMPTSFGTQTLIPELLKTLQTDMQNSALYDHALYREGVLISSSHNFPFTTILPPNFKLKMEYEPRMMNGKEVLWYNAGGKRLIAVVKSGSVFSQAITVFAYVFSCFVLLYLLEQFLAKLLSGPYRFRFFWKGKSFSIRSKIRWTVILVSTLSFVLIGIATVYFFIFRYKQNNDNRLSQLVSTVEKDLKSTTDISSLFQQPYVIGTSSAGTGSSSTVTGLAELFGTDINLFDLKGNLIVASQPVLYDQGIISTKMNPVAFYQMAYNHQIQFLQTETIGQLAYQGVYLPIRNTAGTTLGYINIPYFASQVELNQEISNFLVTLINLIAFISIIAGVIAFFITNSITTSFFIIGQKMKAVSLGKTNEPIEWNRNDEIGNLVQQYNKMLEQLDESARKLASSEREYAWREMAKQVAHEIKNPLTPMKLNLQYLQRQLENDAPNVKQMTIKTATMLVTQIDHLNQIASDFSQLARINETRVEEFDLNEVLNEVVLLYQMDNHLDITWQPPATSFPVAADRTQLNRLFTNLIKNASEAVEEEQAIIEITEKMEGDTVVIAISDNGPGIPPEMQSQLFVPNFTTKSSGSGLGLAICKDIVERAGGSIWFQSTIGGPTTFFVQLPIAKTNYR